MEFPNPSTLFAQVGADCNTVDNLLETPLVVSAKHGHAGLSTSPFLNGSLLLAWDISQSFLR